MATEVRNKCYNNAGGVIGEKEKKDLKTKDKHLAFHVTGLMELVDEVKERSDRGQTELRKLSLEQQLSLTQVGRKYIAKVGERLLE